MRTCRDPNQRTKVRQFGNSSFDWMCPLEYTAYITIVHIYIYSIQIYIYIWYNGDSRDFSICQGSRLLWERWKQGILSLCIEPRAVSQPPNQNWWFMTTPKSFVSDGTMVSRGSYQKWFAFDVGTMMICRDFWKEAVLLLVDTSSFSWSSL